MLVGVWGWKGTLAKGRNKIFVFLTRCVRSTYVYFFFFLFFRVNETKRRIGTEGNVRYMARWKFFFYFSYFLSFYQEIIYSQLYFFFFIFTEIDLERSLISFEKTIAYRFETISFLFPRTMTRKSYANDDRTIFLCKKKKEKKKQKKINDTFDRFR